MKDDHFITSVCIRLINCFKESDAQEETNQMAWRLFILGHCNKLQGKQLAIWTEY